MEGRSIEELKEILEQSTGIKLFLQGEEFLKVPVTVEFHEEYMEFDAEERRILRVEYAGIGNVGYEKNFRIQILTFTYDKLHIAMQIR